MLCGFIEIVYLCSMLRIVTHIERLLLVHDCVIVPKFGGFVLQAVPAKRNEVEHTFCPLRKEIGFNVTLQHSDGLLSESYMKMYDVNFRKAGLMLEEDVEGMLHSLQQYKRLSLGVLGSFYLGEEGQLVFQPNEADQFSPESYGLSVFHFLPLAPLQVEQEEQPLGKKKKDILYIPVNRKLLRIAVASAAAVALFLLISTPVKDVNQAAYKASFVPTEMVSYKPVISQPVTPDSLREVPKVKSESSEEVIAREVKLVVSSTPKVETASVPSQKMYHIVIASFPTETQADAYMAGVDRSVCKRVNKVLRDGKYRIYADRFDNRDSAETYMATLRNNSKYKDAWLFISR